MIIVFTSNTNGAMTQMTIHLTKEFVEMGEDAVCFIPSQATVTVPDFLKNISLFLKATVNSTHLQEQDHLFRNQILRWNVLS